jgi:SAM-dependent methyltransferase
MTVQEIWEKFCGEKPAIDVGCGWWTVLNFEYVKFDKASQILGQATCVNHYGDFHDLSDFDDGTFAFVNATQVIEHAKFPEKALSEWLRVLRVGGIIHLNWPVMEVWDRDKLEELEKAVAQGKFVEYQALGGFLTWIVKDKDGKSFLDVHYSKITLDFIKACLGSQVEVLLEDGCSLIGRKLH